ncbi:MAG: hypothetical protein ACREEM_21945 [Blastocatellia bacterium]
MLNASVQQAAPLDSHQFLDRLNLMYHHAMVPKLLADPEAVLDRARKNIERWMPAHEGTFSAHALTEWLTLLNTKSVSELIAIITQDSDEGQRLRQSTPFTGILSEVEREELWRHCEKREPVRSDSPRDRT